MYWYTILLSTIATYTTTLSTITVYHCRPIRAGCRALHAGLIGLDEILRFELFASYGQTVVERIYSHWEVSSGVYMHMCMDDFLRLAQMAEDKEPRESLSFWFRIADVDGDGVIGHGDIKWMYDQIYKVGGGRRWCELDPGV